MTVVRDQEAEERRGQALDNLARLFAKAVVVDWIKEQSRAESQPDAHAGVWKRFRAKSRTQAT